MLDGVLLDRAPALLSLGDSLTAWSDTDAATADPTTAGRAWTRQIHLCLLNRAILLGHTFFFGIARPRK